MTKQPIALVVCDSAPDLEPNTRTKAPAGAANIPVELIGEPGLAAWSLLGAATAVLIGALLGVISLAM